MPIVFFLLPLALPLYVLRFRLGLLPTTGLEVAIVIALIIWIIGQTRAHRGLGWLPVSWNTLGAWRGPIIAWTLATFLAVLIAPDRFAALGHWRAFVLEPLLVFWMVRNSPWPRGLKEGIATITIIMGVYAILQFATGWGIPHPWDVWPGRRATGVFGFPNGLALFMAPFGIACWIAFLNARRRVFAVATGLAAIAVALAMSVGGLVALGTGAVLTLIAKKKTRTVGLIAAGIGLALAVAASVMVLTATLHPQRINATPATAKKWSVMVRTVIWKESIAIIKDHPVFGTGLRSYQTAVAPYHQATWMEIFPHPHNLVLMLWIETGLFGLLAFGWICWTWVRLGGTASWFAVIPLAVILIQGLIDVPYFKNDLAVQFWILAALASFADRDGRL